MAASRRHAGGLHSSASARDAAFAGGASAEEALTGAPLCCRGEGVPALSGKRSSNRRRSAAAAAWPVVCARQIKFLREPLPLLQIREVGVGLSPVQPCPKLADEAAPHRFLGSLARHLGIAPAGQLVEFGDQAERSFTVAVPTAPCKVDNVAEGVAADQSGFVLHMAYQQPPTSIRGCPEPRPTGPAGRPQPRGGGPAGSRDRCRNLWCGARRPRRPPGVPAPRARPPLCWRRFGPAGARSPRAWRLDVTAMASALGMGMPAGPAGFSFTAT